MNPLVALGSGIPWLWLLLAPLVIALPVMALFLGFRRRSYTDAFLVALVLSLLWVGLGAVVEHSILSIVFGLGSYVKALFYEFIFIGLIFLMAVLGQWLRQRGKGAKRNPLENGPL
jgi:hypothetical protein